MHRSVRAGIIILMANVGCAHAQAQQAVLPGKSHLSVEQRLRLTEDKDEIRELLIAYGRDFDKRDFTAYANLFATDGVWVGGADGSHPYTGPTAIREFVTKMAPEGWADPKDVWPDDPNAGK